MAQGLMREGDRSTCHYNSCDELSDMEKSQPGPGGAGVDDQNPGWPGVHVGGDVIEPRLEECVGSSPWEEWHSGKKEQWGGTGEQSSLGGSRGMLGSEAAARGRRQALWELCCG